MPRITFTEDYGFAEDGISTTHFKAGQTERVSQSCFDSAIQCGKAFDPDADLTPPGGKKKQEEVLVNAPTQKAKEAVPENKAKAKPANKAKPAPAIKAKKN